MVCFGSRCHPSADFLAAGRIWGRLGWGAENIYKECPYRAAITV